MTRSNPRGEKSREKEAWDDYVEKNQVLPQKKAPPKSKGKPNEAKNKYKAQRGTKSNTY
jgi:hypothetical protein